MHIVVSRLTLAVLVAIASPALAHDGPHDQKKVACAGHGLECAAVATSAFAPDGTLWTVWAANDRVAVSNSKDGGTTFAPAVLLPATELSLDNGPDARPRIAIGSTGEIYVTFAARDAKYNGTADVARSVDGGRTFSVPSPITSGSPSQRFETVAIDGEGRVFAAWIDKRNGAAAKRDNRPYAGAALAYAWIDGTSGKVGDGAIAKDNTCECCRIAVAFAAPGRPVVVFRNIFEGSVRDHGIVTFADGKTPGPVLRVSDDDAVTDSCPHHGPSLAIGDDGRYHVTWAAVGRKLKGVYYAHSSDQGVTFSKPLRLGSPDRQISRPFVLAHAGIVYLAYKSFDGERTRIDLMTSRDGGQTWSTPRGLAETASESDHPLLIAGAGGVYLSWVSQGDGYRLLAVEAQP
jgi:hypothetical protein